MGFKTFGFAGGRTDDWEPDLVYWGPEKKWLADERYTGDRKLTEPAGRRADGPHLREPRGPERQPRSARRREGHPRDLRPHGDERRGDRRADRRRPHLRQGARRRTPSKCVGAEPAAAGSRSRARLEEQLRQGQRGDTVTSGLEGAWTCQPTAWTTQYLDNLFAFEWVKTKSPAGATQWIPKDAAARTWCPTRTTRASATRRSCSPPTSR
jgi:catalase-peroxidase